MRQMTRGGGGGCEAGGFRGGVTLGPCRSAPLIAGCARCDGRRAFRGDGGFVGEGTPGGGSRMENGNGERFGRPARAGVGRVDGGWGTRIATRAKGTRAILHFGRGLTCHGTTGATTGRRGKHGGEEEECFVVVWLGESVSFPVGPRQAGFLHPNSHCPTNRECTQSTVASTFESTSKSIE